MIPLLLTLIIFFYWTHLGSSFLKLTLPHVEKLNNLLLAPAVGISLTILPIFWLSRMGLGVKTFAWFIFISLVVFATALTFFYRKSQIPRTYLAYCIIFILAALLCGWPFLLYGFDWLSFCNNDMANYCLLAKRYLTHGFFDVPTVESIFSGKDQSQAYWLQGLIERAGSELMLSWISALTGLSTTKCFMILIIAFHLSIISSTCSFAYSSGVNKQTIIITASLLACAPLLSFGAQYQLLGQTFGLAILMGCLSASKIMLNDLFSSGKYLLQHILLSAILFSCLLIAYPEVSPFYIACIGAYFFFAFLSYLPQIRLILNKFKLHYKRLLLYSAGTLLIILVFLQRYIFCFASFLLNQIHGAVIAQSRAEELFQQYLLPSGLAGIWGLLNIYTLADEPWLSIFIFISIVLFAYIIIFTFKNILQNNFVLTSFFVMLLGVITLRILGSSFGLYKMVMYIQPFLWTAFAIALSTIKARNILYPLCLMTIILLTARTQWSYADLSRGEPGKKGGAFNEIYRASSTKALSELENLAVALSNKGETRFISDTDNVVIAKLLAHALSNNFLSFPFFDLYPSKRILLKIPQAPELEEKQQVLRNAEAGRVFTAEFDLKNKPEEKQINTFWIENKTQPGETSASQFSLISSSASQTIFNRKNTEVFSKNFNVRNWEDVANHLIFVYSELGNIYYNHRRDKIAIYQLEPDYFYPGNTMAGVGRYFVFQVVNPTTSPRLVIEITSSLKNDGVNSLPPVAVIGTSRKSFNVQGRGSARLISEPIEPQTIMNRHYLGLDMGVHGTRWKEVRTGLMKLFGRDIISDPRLLVGFSRNISLISAEEFATLSAPDKIADFPKDLDNPGLEYSGIYEDGWLSEHSYFLLKPSSTATQFLEVKGSIPLISDNNFAANISLKVNDNNIINGTFLPGEFTIQTIIPGSASRQKVELHFDRGQNFTGLDNRPVAAKLQGIAFKEIISRGDDIIPANTKMLLGRNWHNLESTAQEKFRWVRNDAELLVGDISNVQTSDDGQEVTITLDIEPGPGLRGEPAHLILFNNEQESLGQADIDKRSTITFKLPATKVVNRSLTLSIDNYGEAVGLDKRILNFRVFKISLLHSSGY